MILDAFTRSIPEHEPKMRLRTRELAATHDQLDREHKRLTSEAGIPQYYRTRRWAWDDLSPADQRALTEILIDKIVIYPHPHVMDAARRRHYTFRAIPYQDPEMEAARLERCTSTGQDRPEGLSAQSTDFLRRNSGARSVRERAFASKE
jgi:hypothetical protein